MPSNMLVPANQTLSLTAQGNYTETPVLFAPDKPRVVHGRYDASEGFSALVQTALDVLINPDVAFRTNRQLSEQMIRDPMVISPLSERMLATAQLDWEIVPNAENLTEGTPEYEDAHRIAGEIEQQFKRMEYQQDFFRELLWATFRGTGAAQVNWQYDEAARYYYPARHRPVNGDKILYDRWGSPRLQTRQYQTGGRELDAQERDEFVIHRYDPEDGSFYQGAEAAYQFKGRGLRDIMWPFWWLKHNALRFWLNFLERFGGGMAIGRYPMGNKDAKAAVEATLRNMIDNPIVSMPVPAGAEDKEVYGIERATVSGVSSNTSAFKEFVEDWAGRHIRILIKGNDQAHQTSGDGLGSGRAEALQDVFRMYRDYDAGCLADTLTTQVVQRLVRFNYGSLPWQFRWQFVLEKKNYEQEEKRVKAAKELGLKVATDWAYEALDIPQPKADEAVLDFGAMNQAALGMGQPGSGPLFDGGGVDDHLLFGGHEQTQEKAHLLFQEAMRDRVGYWDEREHPRDKDGEFEEKQGGGAGSSGDKAIKEIVNDVAGNVGTTQARAKAGGEIGPNGEHYKGGAFIATTDMPKRMRQDLEKKASRKGVMVEPAWGQKPVYKDLQPGEMSIIDKRGTYLNRDMTINHQAAAYYGIDTKQLQELVDRYKKGERVVSVVDYPALANIEDVARLVVANKPIPGAVLDKLPPEYRDRLKKWTPKEDGGNA